jgi:DNA-binding MarR family transcriptional regulator
MADASPTLPTYRKALLQVLAYKNIQIVVNKALGQFDLSTTQWIILGLLSEYPEGLRTTDFAAALQVEVPFITTLTQPLLKREIVTQRAHHIDKRAKLFALTEEGQLLVIEIEQKLALRLRAIENGISMAQLSTYFSALRSLIDNTVPLRLPTRDN